MFRMNILMSRRTPCPAVRLVDLRSRPAPALAVIRHCSPSAESPLLRKRRLMAAANKANQNLKILEELQKKQQQLLKNQRPEKGADESSSGSGAAASQRERAALQNCMQNSSGYFVSQDSSFGNLVLPVLPRFGKKV